MPPPPLTTTILLTLLFLLHSSATTTTTTRRLLHQPFFPLSSQPPSPSPSTSQNTLPKLPFSSTTTPPTTTTTNNPFFPTLTSPPPPPPPPLSTSLPTFPANISSLALPTSHSPPSHSSPSPKLTITLILLSFLTISLISSLFIILRRKHRRHHHPISDTTSLYPPNLPPSDTSTTTKLPTTSKTSSEFLYLGTLANASSEQQPVVTTNNITHHVVECELQDHDHQVEHSEIYLKLCGTGSPELKPLPPLPKQSFHSHSFDDSKPIDDEEFYSPTASSSVNNAANDHKSYYYCYNSSYLTSPEKSPENTHMGSPESDVSVEIRELAAAPAPPPPPPPPMPAKPWGNPVSGPTAGRSWASSGSGSGGPPPLFPPSGPVGLHRSGTLKDGGNCERNEEGYGKTKLKALHWDKVRASSDRVMVWDQLKPGSFQLNEEMIETLFKVNGPTTMGGKDGGRRSIMPLLNEETRVLDPKKSQNVAILLKALNVTEDEVCEALLEGNADTLGTELLESLNKMAPTKEEERNLKEYKDESPLKLGPAEKFLKAVLNVPFAFKRVEAMLYMATFDSEVEYLRKSFETLEVACGELRNSRMFLRLLEAVLKTGNRMNDGTNRGDAQAFKLDTLLKLVDIKGTDGKTTLLHFVVQEIIKAEGSRLSQTNQDPTPSKTHDIELRKQGLEVVAGLGGELTNVKKAAAMDSDSLSADVAKLARGIMKVNEVLQLNEGTERTETKKRFSESMNMFLKKAEMEIVRIQSQESSAFSRVKELTEYFHGNLSKEEAHPLRIFMVVRDFLGVLDQVCKEVGKINDRTTISSVRPFPVSVNPTVPPPFPVFTGSQRESSSDDEGIVLV